MKFRDLLLLLEDDGDDDPPQVPGDTEGIEPGETGMPRGQGYPNAKFSIDKVIWLGYISGVTPDEIKQYDEKYALQLKDFIKTKTPWLVPYEGYSYDYLSTVSDINNFVVNASNRFRYWLNSDLSLDVFRDNPELDKERKQKILDIVEMYPDAVAQLDKLQEYLNYVEQDNPENPENQSNYPLFVSLYDQTRSLGGHEEGGWWYDVMNLVESKKVNDFKQAENAARYLYNKLDNMDLDGQPAILLEKISGGEDTTKKPAPVYESKYTSVAKQVVASLQPNVYRPGDEMVRFTFEYSTGDEIDIEDFVANDIVQAPSNLVYTGIDYFFVRKSHPVVKSDVYYCKDPLVIETQKLFNQGLSVGEGAITEDLWEEYAGKIDYFYRYYVIENKDEEINESKYAKAAKQVIDNAVPPKEPVLHLIVKMEYDGLFPAQPIEKNAVIPQSARKTIDGIYIDTAPSIGKPIPEEAPDYPKFGLDENHYYTLYVTKPEYMKIFLDWDFESEQGSALLSGLYDSLMLDGDRDPVLP
jgi:hypothetical protein